MKEALLASTRSLLLTALILSSSALPALAYFHPEEGRWISRDPIGDNAFLTGFSIGKAPKVQLALQSIALRPAYVFVDNSPPSRADVLGLLSLNEAAQKAGENRPAGISDTYTMGLMLCLLWRESSFNENASNPASSAKGIAQILNGTADYIQDTMAPNFGVLSDPFYLLSPGQRLRDNRTNPDVSIYAAYLLLNKYGFTSTGYGPDSGNKVAKCSKCCGIIKFDQDGNIANPTEVWKCLHIIHN